MRFYEVVTQAIALLQREGRVSYRALQLEFDLTDEILNAVKEELIDIKELATEQDGRMLVWVGSPEEGKGKRENGEADKGRNGKNETTGPDATERQAPSRWTPGHLAERIRAATVTDGERKTITALFADLKGSTALIEGLDPEEARAIIDPALQLMMDAVHRYEGYVAQALGDGIFALFGAPLAHEDHPQRALYAALRMQEEMRRYSDQIRLQHGVPLAMRVGINTGEVVVRSIRKDDLHADYVPVGHSTNLAARMEQMATPGSILITEHTQQLVEGYFELKSLGAAEIKGVEVPLHVYEVLSAGPLRTRLQVAARRGLTRFVGRQRELEHLRSTWEQAKARRGQIVGVMGEPGLGKSRLFYEFKLLSQSGGLILEAYSVSHGKASPYLPVIELLKSYFRIESQDDERTRREKVGGKVLMLDRGLEDTLSYLFALLGIEEQPSPLQQMDPQIRRKRTFEALKKLFLRESLNQPLMLIFEDLHWIDSETQGFLDTLSEGVAPAKILLLVNYRPEYRQEWGQKTYYTQLRLAPFGKAESEEFLDELLGGEPHLTPLKQLILDKTEGTPFFIEEVVQTLVEDGTLAGGRGHYTLTRQPTTLHLPTTVQGVLAARIDRLTPDEKTLLQQLAVIGREFPLGLVRQVITQPEDELHHLLSSLQHKEFLYEQPAFPEVEYLFKHALTQEVAYNTVLIERRKALHKQTGQAIEQLYHDRLDEHYSELAHHYQRSGNAEKAIHYLHLAGQQAAQRSANAEAIQHLTSALQLLQDLPHSPARDQQELSLQVKLGPILMSARGQGAAETGAAFNRAYELCRQMGDTPQLFSVMSGLRRFYSGIGSIPTAHGLAQQMFSLAQRLQDSSLLVEAHQALGNILYWQGEFLPAQALVEEGIRLHDVHQHKSLAVRYGLDPGVNCRNFAANVLWFLGYPDQALQRSPEAYAAARELNHPFSMLFALMFSLSLRQLRREALAVQEQADTLIELATEQGFPQVLTWATIMRGWSVAVQGHTEEGIPLIQEGLAAGRILGLENLRAYRLGLRAEAYQHAGQLEEALATIEEAFAVIDSIGPSFWLAELHRLKGELTLQQESEEHGAQSTEQKSENRDPRSQILDLQDEAEACFLKAIAVSQKQQAKSLELRATVSLARLWQQQRKRAEAHQMLSEIYSWFTEGFDTKDLQEAKALIEELSH